MASITSANAIYTIAIPGIFPTPQRLQEFATDEIFDTDPQEIKELLMGVDGKLSAGFVFVPARQGISLQADSRSMFVFDTWNAVEFAARDTFAAVGNISLPSIGMKWALTNGYLATFPPIPNAAKSLRPRKFFITWESVSPALI